MGKASKRRDTRQTTGTTNTPSAAPAPFARRPFEGLIGETEWVAMREIVPAATATVRFVGSAAPQDAPGEATMATVLPMAWPALHRNDGAVMVSTQAGATCGDASRDIAAAWLLAADVPAGIPITQVPTATAATPRLQELIDPAQPFELTIHSDFGYWVDDAELDEGGIASLERANESIVPTVRVAGAPSVYWVDFGERSFVRWVLPQDEDAATDGLARLIAAGQAKLTETTRLLGAFRACGLLVPVWEIEHGLTAAEFADPVQGMRERLDEAIGSSAPLDADQRRARNGLLSRQVTLR